ncbi:MAG: VWA domain-containing protein [Planctomycetes bacterium]|nr:VWA domain-containing protein [Planctomycetota bacterium]
MSLLAPWALWFGFVAPLIVGLYLLKIRRQQELVPALEFWMRLAGPAPVRSLFQRLKRWLSLLLWLAIVACLLLALGNPVITAGSIKPQSIAIILDNSASMQTQETDHGDQTRFELARKEIERITKFRPVRDEWLLINAARRPQVMQPWTRDRNAIREALQDVAPHRGSSDLRSAAALANQLLSGKVDPLIVVISDGAHGAVESLVQDSQNVAFVRVGNTQDNLGITDIRVRMHPQMTAHHVYLSVSNSSDQDIESQVTFELDRNVVEVRPFSAKARSEWRHTLTLQAPEGGVLSARIERPDALAIDNQAFAVLEPVRAAHILLVSPEEQAYFFEQSLLAMGPLVDQARSRTVSLEEYELLADAERSADLVIFNGVKPTVLPALGAFLFVNSWTSDVPASTIGELTMPSLSIAKRDHPLTQYLNLGGVTIARAHEVDLREPAVVLASSQNGSPMIFLFSRPDQQFLCLAFDVLDSDLPFRNAFPILLRNAVAYFMTQGHAWVKDQYTIGDTIRSLRPLPSNISSIKFARMGGESISEESALVEQNEFAVDATSEVGVLRFALNDEFAYAAVNLASYDETMIAVSEQKLGESHLSLSTGLGGMTPWLALSAIATLLIAGEWLTYHFRWTE